MPRCEKPAGPNTATKRSALQPVMKGRRSWPASPKKAFERPGRLASARSQPATAGLSRARPHTHSHGSGIEVRSGEWEARRLRTIPPQKYRRSSAWDSPRGTAWRILETRMIQSEPMPVACKIVTRGQMHFASADADDDRPQRR
eukprot:6189807-Pleurochrysis_carterae.AAC.2